jgi:hypothetical protein
MLPAVGTRNICQKPAQSYVDRTGLKRDLRQVEKIFRGQTFAFRRDCRCRRIRFWRR